MPRRLVQQGARRYRLHGLAEAHVVGQQRALPKRQMEHPFDLIGQQRLLEQVKGGATGGQALLEAVILALPPPHRPAFGDPGLQPARDAQGVAACPG